MRAAALLAGLVLTACAREPVTIDGSSAENFAASAEAARRDLEVADRLAFDRALALPPGRRSNERPEEVRERARRIYDGMTANQVVEMSR